MGRGEVSKKRRDIRTQENRDPVILKNWRRDHSRESRVDTCQENPQSRNLENRSSRARRNLVIRNRDPRIRDNIWTIYIRGHVAEICTIGESPNKEQVHR
jgi:hypothetical protein